MSHISELQKNKEHNHVSKSKPKSKYHITNPNQIQTSATKSKTKSKTSKVKSKSKPNPKFKPKSKSSKTNPKLWVCCIPTLMQYRLIANKPLLRVISLSLKTMVHKSKSKPNPKFKPKSKSSKTNPKFWVCCIPTLMQYRLIANKPLLRVISLSLKTMVHNNR
ncbi:unnamed protein product [Rotaria magnacalcarata]|uniref:Uncharacterized protein n=1 Tax=Rotaria magnacalcarata TaxID=392030 RepID=A0A8S2JWU3_9BILA|nr:unnamed protein product [Rotaria magnacalcarata]